MTTARTDILVRMAAQYGHALWSNRPVSRWMKTDPVIADGDMTVAEFCGRVLEERPSERPSELLQGFIVTWGGRYAGVGTALSLLQATASATASYAQEMTGLAQDAQAAKGRFLAVMSHEIRTPLNGVLAVVEKPIKPDRLLAAMNAVLDVESSSPPAQREGRGG